MDRIDNITQVYTQAPWRKQLQFIGLFSLILVFIALVAGIYLNVSAQTAKAGREIQYKKSQIETLDREIEDMQSLLAHLLSDSLMEKRAIGLGYESLEINQAQYLLVPGYIERNTVVLAPFTRENLAQAPVIPDKFTEPLIEWIRKQASWISFSLPEVVP